MALSGDVLLQTELGFHNTFPVRASTKIYEGGAVGIDTAGNARPVNAGDKFGGFAVAQADNSSGAAGDIRVQTMAAGRVQLAVSGAAATDLHRAVFASDDGTYTFTGAGNTYIGKVCRYISSGVVMVAFDATSSPLGYSDQFTPLYGKNNSIIAGNLSGALTTLIGPNATYNATEHARNYQMLKTQLDGLMKMIKTGA